MGKDESRGRQALLAMLIALALVTGGCGDDQNIPAADQQVAAQDDEDDDDDDSVIDIDLHKKSFTAVAVRT